MQRNRGFILVEELVVFSLCCLLLAGVALALSRCLRVQQETLSLQQCLEAAQQELAGEEAQLLGQRRVQRLENIQVVELEVQHGRTRLNLLWAEQP